MKISSDDWFLEWCGGVYSHKMGVTVFSAADIPLQEIKSPLEISIYI